MGFFISMVIGIIIGVCATAIVIVVIEDLQNKKDSGATGCKSADT